MNSKRKIKREYSEVDKKEVEIQTEDIYDDAQLEKMLKNDEITEAEYSYMLGREKVGKEKELGLTRKKHKDSTSVELAEKEYYDD